MRRSNVQPMSVVLSGHPALSTKESLAEDVSVPGTALPGPLPTYPVPGGGKFSRAPSGFGILGFTNAPLMNEFRRSAPPHVRRS